VRATRVLGAVSLLVLAGAIAWSIDDDEFWAHHTLFTGLVASLIVVAITAAVVNDVLERRQRERWSVLAQFAMFEFVRMARLVWSGLLELAGMVPDGELGPEALANGSRRHVTRHVSLPRWMSSSPAPSSASGCTAR
jgi:hypothetical protein